MAEPQSAVVAVFRTHARAEAAVDALRQAGIGAESISVAGKGEDKERVTAHYTRAGEVKHHGGHRRLWGLLSGLLSDTGSFYIPGTGPLFVAGPIVGWVGNVLEGHHPDAERNPVGAGLASIGIPPERVHDYESALQSGRILVIVHGAPDLVSHAHAVLKDTAHVSATVFGGS